MGSHNLIYKMSFTNIICLVVLQSGLYVRGEDPILEEGEGAEEAKNVEMDWSEMLQMGMALGKSILGEEAIERLKKGDLSKLIEVGEKVLGEDTIKDFLNAATEGAFVPKEETKEKTETLESENILEEEEDELTDDNENTEINVEISKEEEAMEADEDELSLAEAEPGTEKL